MLNWGELNEVMQRAVQAMRSQQVPVTPRRVEHVVNAVAEHRDRVKTEERLFAPPQPYWTLSADEMAKLKAEAHELQVVVDNPGSTWADRTRAEQRLRELERRITAGRLDRQPWMRPEVHGS